MASVHAAAAFTRSSDSVHGIFNPQIEAEVEDQMETALTTIEAERPASLVGRLWGAALAVWGGFVGLLPHVLHHIGPLAGAALLAGATGRVLFAAVGLVAAIPFLRRLRRRFDTWKAPAIALAIFAVMFSLSSFVIGPAIAGEDAPAGPAIEEDGHAAHH